MLGGCFYGNNFNQKRYKYIMYSNFDNLIHNTNVDKCPVEKARRDYIIDSIYFKR